MSTDDKIPSEAYRFALEWNHQFSDVEPADGKYRVQMTAFTGEPITHWWWGRCIFDRAGCVIEQDRIPIDYNHDSEEIGYLENFSGDPQLVCEGYLIPYEKDRAASVIHKAKRGQPYQCSVTVGEYMAVEEVARDATAEVNGMTVSGPITIYRQYSIIGVAICTYGTDGQTTATVFNKGTQMAKDHNDTAPKPLEPRELFKKFQKMFGNERAARYFGEELTEEQAKDKYTDEVVTESGDKDQQIADLTAKVTALETAIQEKDTKIAELETKATASGEQAAAQTDFANRVASTAGTFKAEQSPVSGGVETPKPKKTFSPLPEKANAFAKRIAGSTAFKAAGAE